MADKEKYMINIQGKLIEVSEDVYYAYFRMERQERTQEEKQKRNEVMSYDALDNGETGDYPAIIDEASIIGCLTMPASIVLHEGDILALDRFHDNSGGLALHFLGALQSGFDLLEVVTIDVTHMEAESCQLIPNRIRTHDFIDSAVNLKTVIINDDHQVVQLVVGCQHAGLPDLAFLDLAVAQQGVDTSGLALVLQAQRHACGAGDTLAQGAGGHIDAGNGVHVGIALEIGVDVAQGGQVFHGEEATQGQCRIQAGSGVALGKNEAVTVFPLGIGRIHVHLLEVQIGKHISRRQAAAGMAGFGTVGGFDHAHAHLAGSLLQLLLFVIVH